MNNKARHNLINAKFRWCSDRLDSAGSFWETFVQTKVMQIPAHESCCLVAQLVYGPFRFSMFWHDCVCNFKFSLHNFYQKTFSIFQKIVFCPEIYLCCEPRLKTKQPRWWQCWFCALQSLSVESDWVQRNVWVSRWLPFNPLLDSKNLI